MSQHKDFFGLLHRRVCLLPTWRGLILILFVAAGLMLMAIFNVQSFLAQSEPVTADVLVVEGWVSDYVMEAAVTEFRRGRYNKLYVTGGPLEAGSMLSEHKTHAELGATILEKMGISADLIEAVPAPAVRRDRTYASALALKDRLLQQTPTVKNINLLSVGVHARRSRLLFQKALANDYRVGIIAIEDRNYASKRWWISSNGTRAVIDELFAYIYALLVFPFVES